jgi:hypothetical protein
MAVCWQDLSFAGWALPGFIAELLARFARPIPFVVKKELFGIKKTPLPLGEEL